MYARSLPWRSVYYRCRRVHNWTTCLSLQCHLHQHWRTRRLRVCLQERIHWKWENMVCRWVLICSLTQYHNSLLTIGNSLKKQYKGLTPSIKPPYTLLWAYGSSWHICALVATAVPVTKATRMESPNTALVEHAQVRLTNLNNTGTRPCWPY